MSLCSSMSAMGDKVAPPRPRQKRYAKGSLKKVITLDNLGRLIESVLHEPVVCVKYHTEDENVATNGYAFVRKDFAEKYGCDVHLTWEQAEIVGAFHSAVACVIPDWFVHSRLSSDYIDVADFDTGFCRIRGKMLLSTDKILDNFCSRVG